MQTGQSVVDDEEEVGVEGEDMLSAWGCDFRSSSRRAAHFIEGEVPCMMKTSEFFVPKFCKNSVGGDRCCFDLFQKFPFKF